MHFHPLPGGVNGMGFGEGEDRYGWFNNATNLDYSLRAVDAANLSCNPLALRIPTHSNR